MTQQTPTEILIVRTLADRDFFERLKTDTSGALREIGIEDPEVIQFVNETVQYISQRDPTRPRRHVLCGSRASSERTAVPANERVILANATEDGRFYTWFAPRRGNPEAYVPNPEALLWLVQYDQWRDIDPVVHANVVLCLGEGPHTAGALAYLIDLVHEHIEQNSSRFYPDALAFYYTLSRPYAWGSRSLRATATRVIQRTLARQRAEGSFGTPLETALAANTLLNFGFAGPELGHAIAYLAAAQRSDGAWEAAPLFREPTRQYGSPELTTALCLEALSRSLAREPGDALSAHSTYAD